MLTIDNFRQGQIVRQPNGDRGEVKIVSRAEDNPAKIDYIIVVWDSGGGSHMVFEDGPIDARTLELEE